MNIKYQLVGILMLLSILGMVSATIDLQNPIDGQYINDTNVTIEVLTNLTVQNATLILDGGIPQNLTYNATISAYTLNLTDLSQGPHKINVTINGTTANETANFTFIVDTIYPAVTVTAPAADMIMPKDFNITATITEDNVQTVQAIIIPDGGIPQEPVNLSIVGSEYVSPTITLAAGIYTYAINVTDLANNTFITAPVNFSVDGEVPVVTNSLPDTDYLINEDYKINATVTDNAGIASVVATVKNISTGTFTEYTLSNISGDFYETNLIPVVEDAALSYNITATDIHGNKITTTSINYFTDVTAPTITINSPAPNVPTMSVPIIGLTPFDVSFSVDEIVGMSEAIIDGTPITLTPVGQTFTGPSNGLIEGLHELNISVEDEAGNIANKSLNFVVDTSAPVISEVSPANDSILPSNIKLSALVTDYNVSNVSVLIHDIVKDNYNTVNMSLNGTGYYETELLLLEDGNYNFVINATDVVKNTALLNASNITIDATGPTFSNIMPVNNSIVSSNVEISATVTDSTGVGIVQAYITPKGGIPSLINLTYNDTLGYYTNNTTLAGNDYSFIINATDVFGKGAASESINITVDATAPKISDIMPANGSKIPSNVIITANITDSLSNMGQVNVEIINETGNIIIKSMSYSDMSKLYQTPDVVLPEGNYQFTIKAKDDKGNENISAPVNFTVDMSAPVITIFDPIEQGSGSMGDSFNVTFKLDELVTMYSAIIDKDTPGSINVPLINNSTTYTGAVIGLSDGVHTLNVTAMDICGNTATKTISFNVDATAPAISEVNPINKSIVPSDFVLSATVTESNTIDKVVAIITPEGGVAQAPINLAYNTTSGKYEVRVNTLTSGKYSFILAANDTSGNADMTSFYNITVDATAPKINVTNPLEGMITPEGVIFTANITDVSNIASVQAIVTGATSKTVNLTYNATTELYENDSVSFNDGAHAFTITAIDALGNENVSAPINFVVDATAPKINVTNPLEGMITPEGVIFTANITDVSNIASVQAIVTGATSKTVNLTYNATTELYENDSVSFNDGAHAFTITAIDVLGNENTSAQVNFVVDAIAPQITNAKPTTDSILSGTFKINATVTDTNLDSVVAYMNDSETPITLSQVGTSDLYENDSLTKASGKYNCTIVAMDKVGNNATFSAIITVDATAPTVEIKNPLEGMVTPEGVIFIANVTDISDIASVQAIVTSGATTKPVNLTYNTSLKMYVNDSVSLNEGAHAFTITAIDALGNENTSAPVNFVVDATAPQIINPKPTNDGFVKDTFKINATVTDANVSTVVAKLNDSETPITLNQVGTSDFYESNPLTKSVSGKYKYTIIAIDSVGNNATSTATFTVDATAPVVVSTTPNAGVVIPNNFKIGATVTETNVDTAIATLTKTIDSSTTGISLRFNTTSSKYESDIIDVFPTGDYTYTVTVTDKAGNSATSNSVSFKLDVDNPAITNAKPGTNSIVPSKFKINATVTDTNLDSVIAKLNDSETEIILSQVGTSDLYENDSLNKTTGKYKYIIIATDLAGNTANTTATFTVDATAPEIVSTKPSAGATVGSTTNIQVKVNENSTVNISLINSTNSLNPITLDLNEDPNNVNLHTGSVSNLKTGEYTLKITAIDIYGNKFNNDGIVFNVNATLPVVEITKPTTGSLFNDSTAPILINVTGEEGATINATVYSNVTGSPLNAIEPIDLVKDGETTDFTGYTSSVELPEGNYTVIARAKSMYNNTATSSAVHFKIDLTNPSVTDIKPIEGKVVNDGFTINATVKDANGIKNVITTIVAENSSETILALNPVGETNTYESIPIDTLEDGTYTYTITAYDNAGNSNTSDSSSFSVDTTAPTISDVRPVKGYVYIDNAAIIIKATVTDDNIDIVNATLATADKTQENTISMNSIGNNIYETNKMDGLQNGTYLFTINAKDTLGNKKISEEYNFSVKLLTNDTVKKALENISISSDVWDEINISNITTEEHDGYNITSLEFSNESLQIPVMENVSTNISLELKTKLQQANEKAKELNVKLMTSTEAQNSLNKIKESLEQGALLKNGFNVTNVTSEMTTTSNVVSANLKFIAKDTAKKGYVIFRIPLGDFSLSSITVNNGTETTITTTKSKMGWYRVISNDNGKILELTLLKDPEVDIELQKVLPTTSSPRRSSGGGGHYTSDSITTSSMISGSKIVYANLDKNYAKSLKSSVTAYSKDIKIDGDTIIVGGPLANALTKAYMNQFPVSITNSNPGENKGVIQMMTIKSEGTGLVTEYNVVLLAGSDRFGTQAAVEYFKSLSEVPEEPILVQWVDGKAKKIN
ncbi:hypothetical protein M2325_001607 [Methanococcus voltae PS]|uniref:Uncharacterized protein n=1 Tax=Methanococcus voltae PS TaxID=523842 RepID=A0ABT2EY55_METVO|nr:Ig-like domain-containing protein [Methanococcus voltae]MCS3922897.1 hypothetical protein [Methanococcus voltae PS]